MLRALTPALADHGADNQRNANAAAVHVTTFGCDVDKLVHCQHQEVHANMDMNRPQSGEGHADSRATHRVFGQRRTEHALRTKFLQESARRSLNRLGIVHVEAEDDYAWVVDHLLLSRFADGIDVREDAMGARPLTPNPSPQRGEGRPPFPPLPSG